LTSSRKLIRKFPPSWRILHVKAAAMEVVAAVVEEAVDAAPIRIVTCVVWVVEEVAVPVWVDHLLMEVDMVVPQVATVAATEALHLIAVVVMEVATAVAVVAMATHRVPRGLLPGGRRP
jgi:hypothetical protein